MITPRLLLAEIDAAQERARDRDDVAITAAWITAALTRAKKLPKLKKLLERPGDRKKDLRAYLDGLKVVLPTITMAEWSAKAGDAPKPPRE